MMITIDDVLAKVRENNIGGEEVIRRAYLLASKFHEGQFRQSGEPYVTHPLHVAYILACTYNDIETIIAGLLHDTIEDTDITLGEIESMFGSSVARLVDGVSKLKGLNFSSKSEKVEANTAKILRAINEDIRVISIKCADRLHNMETIGFKTVFKQKENALETIDLYVPLAYRIGMYEVKKRLEDLSFKVLNPLEYDDVNRQIEEYKDINKDTLDRIVSNIEKSLRDNNIKGVVKLRIKEVYSTYKKLNKLNKKLNNSNTSIVTLDAVHDLFAVKIITDDYLDCYKALGVIHEEYDIDTSRMKDFIAVPKTNLYKSLHTVFNVNNCLMQAQIRTKDMDMVDTYGLPYYIYSKNKPFSEVQDEIRDSLQFCKDLNFLSEYFERNDLYVEKVKKELFAKENVYVKNKDNKTIELPLGSTPIDLAFLEGDITGYNLGKAIVNGIEVPLDYELKNNDRVSFVMGGSPEDYWLDSVKTTRAKEMILKYKRTCNYS
ncbi:MAG TPA: HD domain-containing protein [Candidatus Onthousia faecipullorum]|uniref:HD domain-containing protein n=1 Tax=Candidatus Onthousia faecipullorum TaxID=2840887 RepID=A0A9D1GB25_9FIRM|nr:HD domain-containing protein [Candidatus Onthousia faecipullorum]